MDNKHTFGVWSVLSGRVTLKAVPKSHRALLLRSQRGLGHKMFQNDSTGDGRGSLVLFKYYVVLFS